MAKTTTSEYRNPTAGSELVYQIPGMHKANVRRDVAYTRRAGQPLLMDVYRPAKAPGGRRLPAVLVGGPPDYSAGKDSGQKVAWSQAIAASGLAAVAFDISSDDFMATPRAPSEDVVAAIAYVRVHADELGVDPDRLCTLGFSFGTAPWHLWAAMHERVPFVRCNAVWYGPLDLHGLPLSITRKNADEFSALTYLRRDKAKIAPMLVVKAGEDENDGINASIDRFVRVARQVRADVTLETAAGAPHGFDLLNDDARTRDLIEETVAFFRKHLGP
ncbi:MAG: alpha/beta hydrolase [Actinomycetota bacterium]|nr:alpha/beta hydrolase [Actinomycetota bacterium]